MSSSYPCQCWHDECPYYGRRLYHHESTGEFLWLHEECAKIHKLDGFERVTEEHPVYLTARFRPPYGPTGYWTEEDWFRWIFGQHPRPRVVSRAAGVK